MIGRIRPHFLRRPFGPTPPRRPRSSISSAAPQTSMLETPTPTKHRPTTPPAMPRLAALRQRLNIEQHLAGPAPPPPTPLRHTLTVDPDPLVDTFSRRHTYLRISLTERCNLRCTYCMPASGVPLSPPPSLLSSPEILELSQIFISAGVNKIRLTGGEPTVRADILDIVRALDGMRAKGLREIAMTSNGVKLGARGGKRLEEMANAGLQALNVSLDTMVPGKFEVLTRRRGWENVMQCIEKAVELGFGLGEGAGVGEGRRLKVNVVVMKGVNDDEVLDFVEFTRHRPIEVRFIEYMPFDGNEWSTRKLLPYASMLSLIHSAHPSFTPTPSQKPNDTAKTWHVPGFAGRVGFITSMTENFCGSCNRLRITGDGNIKVCLFGNEEVSLRDLLRQHRAREDVFGTADDEAMRNEILRAVGMAVKEKREGHKPAEQLNRETGRPMILIDKNSMARRPGIVPLHLLSPSSSFSFQQIRPYSTKPNDLPHLTSTGEAHMVSITTKPHTRRTATAIGHIVFTNPTPYTHIAAATLRKGDVLSVSRVAAIMATKKCPDLVILCHPIALDGVDVAVDLLPPGSGGGEHGGVKVEVRVACTGPTGVEMEALTGVMAAALNVVDMVKAVDRGVRIEGVRVVEKRGGRSGTWKEGLKVQD